MESRRRRGAPVRCPAAGADHDWLVRQLPAVRGNVKRAIRPLMVPDETKMRLELGIRGAGVRSLSKGGGWHRRCWVDPAHVSDLRSAEHPIGERNRL